jgi:hypothetical protein
LLDKIENDNVSIYVANEHKDDVYVYTSEDEVTESIEGDKNYDPESKFSFMSGEVLNSLCSYLDCWIDAKMSKYVYFTFYTNISITKEKQTKRLDRLKIFLPERPILELIAEGKYDEIIEIKNDEASIYDEENLLEIIKKVLIDEYESQYKNSEIKGYLETIKGFTDEIWLDFIKRIHWQFDEEDDKQLEETLIEKIGSTRFYNGLNICGKESYILDALISLLDKKQQKKDYLSRLVSVAEVKVAYLEVSNGVYKRTDPVFELWETLEKPTDKRNAHEKILDVCQDYSQSKLSRIARKIAAVKVEMKNIDIKERGSFQYRLYESCEEKLDMLINKNEDSINEELIDKWLDDIHKVAMKHLEDKSKDYSYPIRNEDTIKNSILELFDSCYLCFDKEEYKNE